jgi:hypothetical protein
MWYRAVRAALLVAMLAAAFYFACAAAPIAKVATGALRTECRDLEQQPEPDYVLFSCDIIDATGIAVNTFAVKAPKKQAAAFRAAHARPASPLEVEKACPTPTSPEEADAFKACIAKLRDAGLK